jgi:hypothetical protein
MSIGTGVGGPGDAVMQAFGLARSALNADASPPFGLWVAE